MMFHSTGAAAVAFPVGALCSLAASFVLVSRLERVAGRIRLSEAMLGLVVALAADAPEITSAVTASAHGQTGIGAGVVLGSNVFNLAALLGLGAIVARRIRLHRKVVILDGAAATWVALVSVSSSRQDCPQVSAWPWSSSSSCPTSSSPRRLRPRCAASDYKLAR